MSVSLNCLLTSCRVRFFELTGNWTRYPVLLLSAVIIYTWRDLFLKKKVDLAKTVELKQISVHFADL